MDGPHHLGKSVAPPSASNGVRWQIAVACLAVAMAAPAAGGAQEIVPPAVRNVTPPGVTPGPAVDGPLIREVPPPPPPEPARWRRFILPETVDAGTFVVDGKRTIHISGVAPPALAETCTVAGGQTWPCGRTALHALRMFLQGRPVECYFPPAGDAVEIVAPCRVGETDIGLWLLGNGWAQPAEFATDDYRQAADAARSAQRGMWRDPR